MALGRTEQRSRAGVKLRAYSRKGAVKRIGDTGKTNGTELAQDAEVDSRREFSQNRPLFKY